MSLNNPASGRRNLWYQEPDETLASDSLRMLASDLWGSQGMRRRNNAEAALRLYTGSMAHSLTGMRDALAVLGFADSGSAYNVVAAITDTKFNALLRNRTRPLFITEAGDSDLKEKVEREQLACDGIAEELGLNDELEEQAVLNGLLFEAGGVEFWADVANSRVLAVPVFAHDFFVSNQEARQGKPYQMFCRQVIPRDVLFGFLANAPKAVRQAVEDAKAATWEDLGGDMASTPGQLHDMVVVYKGWHRPSTQVDISDRRAAFGEPEKETGRRTRPKHDGRHMVVLEGAGNGIPPLVNVPWPYDSFPQAWFKPNRIPGSFWSRGEPEILAAVQVELNQWVRRQGMVMDLHARPIIILAKGAKLQPSLINNSLANIFQVEGNVNGAITVINASAVSPDLVRRVEDLPRWARDQRGMSEMSMTARKPTGVNHEPGLAYLADTETIRHTAEFRALERFKVDCYVNILRCIEELADNNADLELVFEKDNELVKAKWSELRVDQTHFRVRKPPTNLLKTQPAERAEQIMDMVERGFLPPDAAMGAFRDQLDIKALIGDRNVMQQNAEALVDKVIKGPEYTDEMMPDPYMDLQTLKRVGIQRKNKLELNGDKPEKVQRIVTFLQDVDAELAKLAPPAPPAPGPGGPPPPPPPGPPGVTSTPPTLM